MMENVEKWVRVETEIPTSFLEKIKAICELREIDTGTWIRETIAYGLAQEISALTGDEFEELLENFEDAIKKNEVEGGNVE